VTIGPDDLPEDPMAQSGLAQLFCVCTGSVFHFVIGRDRVYAVCANPECGRTMGDYPRGDTPPPQSGPEQISYMGQRDTLREPTPQTPVVHMGWEEAIPAEMLKAVEDPGPLTEMPQPASMDVFDDGGGGAFVHKVPGRYEPAPLPEFSSALCNARLVGGPYDGQITWLAAGVGTFAARGLPGAYRATGKLGEDGRQVYEWASVDVP